jgi:hypothetical protein
MSKEKEPGFWGGTDRSKKKHYYLDNRALCIRGGEFQEGDWRNDNWDPNDPATCPTCRERYKDWIKKGFKRIHAQSAQSNSI